MSILNNDIRAWWIQKSDSCNIANKVEFCDFKPTVHDKGYDWIRVISLDDFHKQTNINITRWVEVCRELQKLQEQNKILIQALCDFRDNGTRHDTNPTGQFKKCGCFDSFKGDNWQSYIKSQDYLVRERAREALAKVDNENN